MQFWQHDDQWAMPFDSPPYPRLPSHYRDVLFQMVYFTTDPANIASMLPPDLTPASSGMCCAFAIDATFCANYGPFKEMGVVVGCQYEGNDAFFLPCLFLTSSDAIGPGREMYGCPKKLARVEMTQEGNELTSTCYRADVPMIQVNSRITAPAEPDDAPPLWPMYMLKIMPSTEGDGPAVKQLVENPPIDNVQTTKLFKGPGVVSFRPTVAGEFWRLEPRTFEGAIYQVCSYTQEYGKVVKDYLA